MNYVVAFLIILNVWLGWKYLAWPGYKLLKVSRKLKPGWPVYTGKEDGAPTKDGFDVGFEVGQAVAPEANASFLRMVASSMMVAFLMMLWSMFLWGSIQVFGGPEEFCSVLLDKL